MKNIHIKRFKEPKAAAEGFPKKMGEIEADDHSWKLAVFDDEPRLYVRVSVEDDNGDITHGYMNVRDIPEDLSVKDVQESVFFD